MTLPVSGAMSMNQVNVELGLSASATISLNDSAVRTLLGKASGQISLSDGYGKSDIFVFSITSNQVNANLRTLAVNAGWNQTSKVVATINSGIYIGSNSTGTPALTINGTFPKGVQLTNNGYIIGMGGGGGTGGNAIYSTAATAGAAAGPALGVSTAVSITNNGTIGGGGGGGGGGGYYHGGFSNTANGGGGGGGRSSHAANSAGGGGGNNGGSGNVSGFGLGGSGSIANNGNVSGAGGNGGDWGSSGASGATGGTTNGAGGGAGGAAVSGNGYITWLATGTRLGAIG